MSCCATRSRATSTRRRHAAWTLAVLGVIVLRSALACHLGGVAVSPLDRLIAASLCITGDGAGQTGGSPTMPAEDPAQGAPACLHCAGGEGSALALLAAGLLAWTRSSRLSSLLRAGTRPRSGAWSGLGPRGPPFVGATAS